MLFNSQLDQTQKGASCGPRRRWSHGSCRLNLLLPAFVLSSSEAEMMDPLWISGGFLAAEGLPPLPRPFPSFPAPSSANYITLIDTPPYINCVELESEAAALSQTIAQLLTRHRNYRLQQIITIDRRIHAFIICTHVRNPLGCALCVKVAPFK